MTGKGGPQPLLTVVQGSPGCELSPLKDPGVSLPWLVLGRDLSCSPLLPGYLGSDCVGPKVNVSGGCCWVDLLLKQ